MDTQTRFDSARFVFEEAPWVDGALFGMIVISYLQSTQGSDKVRFINVDEESSEEEPDSLIRLSRRTADILDRPSTWPVARHAIVFLFSLLLLNMSLLLLPLHQDFQIYIYEKIPSINNILHASMDAMQSESIAT